MNNSKFRYFITKQNDNIFLVYRGALKIKSLLFSLPISGLSDGQTQIKINNFTILVYRYILKIIQIKIVIAYIVIITNKRNTFFEILNLAIFLD